MDFTKPQERLSPEGIYLARWWIVLTNDARNTIIPAPMGGTAYYTRDKGPMIQSRSKVEGDEKTNARVSISTKISDSKILDHQCNPHYCVDRGFLCSDT